MANKTETEQELAPLDQADIEMIKDSRIKVEDLQWLTREEGYIRLGMMQDSHLRNAALMLMGLGYQQYKAPDDLKIRWLTAFRMEWQRRMDERKTTSLAKTTH